MATTRTRPKRRDTLLDYLTLFPAHRITARKAASLPAGDGAPVLVLPGILRDDAQTARLRAGLQMLGYAPEPWGLGANTGPSAEKLDGVKKRLAQLARVHGPVRVVGFSAGGLLARWLAIARPQYVRSVVTICAPFRDALGAAWLPVAPFARFWPGVDVEALAFMVARTPEVPWGAIYSPIDGIVAPGACFDPAAPERCRAVRVRHRAAVGDARVLAAVAELLNEEKKPSA